MCGIMAYNGFRPAKEVLLNGLEKIQYRGYDSMGLLIATPTGFKRVRSVGDLKQLKKKLASKNTKELNSLSGFVGMAHSRWATHGPPLEKNTHPHKAGPFYIVHNGIIENAEELKTWLKGPFLSDTDSEVIAHCLLPRRVGKGKAPRPHGRFCHSSADIKKAIFDTISKIKGEYATLLMSEEHPNEMWAFKKGPSLLIGVGENEAFVCSDIQGILPYTNKVIFLQDGEVAHIQQQKVVHIQKKGQAYPKTKKPVPHKNNNTHPHALQKAYQTKTYDNKNKINIQVFSSKQNQITKKPTLLDQKAEQDEKGKWPCYMLKEIHEQAQCISTLIQSWTKSNHLVFPVQQKNNKTNTSFLDTIIQAGHLNIVACGSSYYAALFGKYVIEKLSHVLVTADMASEFRYRSPSINQTPLLLISQSGETADTLSVLKMAKKNHCPVMSLCNVAHSSLDRATQAKLYMMAGVEKAVGSTKALTATLTTMLLLALCLSKHKQSQNPSHKNNNKVLNFLSKKEEKKWVKDIKSLPNYIKSMLSLEPEYKAVVQKLRTLKTVIYVGRDLYYPLALEGALKIKELTYRHATAYPAGELKHGPLALVDKDTAILGIAPKSPIYHKTIANLEEARCRGGKLIIIGTQGDQKAKAMANIFLPLPLVNEYLSAILCAVPLQMMAYQTACALGHNVDQPRNLAKSVTVE